MKKYLVFAGVTDYPSGGFNDFEDSADDITEAAEIKDKAIANLMVGFRWWQIVDRDKGEIVYAEDNV